MNRFYPIKFLAAPLLAVMLASCGMANEDAANTTSTSGTPSSIHDGHASTTVTSAVTPAGSSSDVTIKLFAYNPSPVVIKAGTTVNWQNDDQIEHTVSFTDGDKPVVGVLPASGARFSHTFSRPGSYSYLCDRHRSMTGTVVVE